MDRLNRRSGLTLGGLTLLLAVATTTGVSAWGNQPAGSAAGLPTLSGSKATQIRTDGDLVLSNFDPHARSLVQLTKESAVDHNDGSALSQNDAVIAASTAVGLSPDSVVSATLTTLTTPSHGFELNPDPKSPSKILPMYQNTATWAVEFANVEVPIHRPAGSDGPTSYQTNMIIFVDAYTGDFMLGSSVDD